MPEVTHENIVRSIQAMETKLSERQRQTDARDSKLDKIVETLRKDVDDIKITIAKMAGGGRVIAFLLTALMTIITGVVVGILVKLW